MNRLIVVLLVVSVGVVCFGTLRGAVKQTSRATSVEEAKWATDRDELAAAQEKLTLLRDEISEKKGRVRQARRHPEISAELLALLEDATSEGHPRAWAELRQQLDMGWNSSREYVLVKKGVLKRLQYQRLVGGDLSLTEETAALLAISSEERSGLRSALERARENEWLRVQRTEPSGDIVAQYTVPVPDPVLDQSISNRFTADVTTVLGPERADLLLPETWRQFRSGLAPAKPETMIIRRSIVDGEPDLICEMKRGAQLSDSISPVRYAHYPSSWFLTLFPGGWETLAQREGFDLPERFHRTDSK